MFSFFTVRRSPSFPIHLALHNTLGYFSKRPLASMETGILRKWSKQDVSRLLFLNRQHSSLSPHLIYIYPNVHFVRLYQGKKKKKKSALLHSPESKRKRTSAMNPVAAILAIAAPVPPPSMSSAIPVPVPPGPGTVASLFARCGGGGNIRLLC